MATPWETIIKVYRKQLGDRCFPTLKAYETDFIGFLRSKNFFTTQEMQMAYLENFARNIIDSVITEVVGQNRGLFENPSAEDQATFLVFLEEKFDSFITSWEEGQVCCEEFVDYSFEMFSEYSSGLFGRINQDLFVVNGITLPEVLVEKIKLSTYHILRAKEDFLSFTGLIFCGFGEEEIYPQLIPVNISMVIDGRLRFYVDEARVASISNENNGAICPFAQTDVIDTILTGIDPSLDNIYLENFEAIFKKYNAAILDSIGDTNELLKEQIENLDSAKLVETFNTMNQQIKRKNYIEPLMSAVSNLSKDDLAEMAESLIYLTYLKRRITFAEESVSGPVDVAIISKGDGFVWIKRKHYFRPELNQHFFDNYFKY